MQKRNKHKAKHRNTSEYLRENVSSNCSPRNMSNNISLVLQV